MVRKKFYRSLSLFLVVLSISVLLSVSVSAAGLGNFGASNAYDDRFTDIDGWFRDYVIAAYESGLVNGVSDTKYAPNATLQLDAAVTLAARIHKIYQTGDAVFEPIPDAEWYRPYYDYCIQNKLFTEKQLPYSHMGNNATRNQVIVAFSKVLPDRELKAMNTVVDDAIPDVPVGSPNAETIYRFYRAGVLTGDSENKFNGNSDILRSEIAAIVTRLTGLTPRSSVTLDKKYIGDQYKDRTDVLVIDGNAYYLGMPEKEAVKLAGKPRETLRAVNLCTVLIYADSDGDNTFMIGVSDGTVRCLYGVGTGFSWNGKKAGDVSKQSHTYYQGEQFEYRASVLVDKFDGNRIHSVLLEERNRRGIIDGTSTVSETLINFYGVNAFRHYHNLPVLKWSGKAFTVASQYSMNMGKNNFFSHYAPDGTSVADRLDSAGVSWNACAENLYRGTDVMGLIVMDEWINSDGNHREPILDRSFAQLGVGMFAVQNPATDQLVCYWTQVFHD